MSVAPWLLLLLAGLSGPRCVERIDPGLPAAAPQEAAPAEIDFDHTHAVWSGVLAEHVKGERFDYQALLEQRGQLDQYLLTLRGVQAEEFETWTREQRYAFWINAYNAFTVHLVLMSYPLKSIKDIGTLVSPVWKKEFIPLGHLTGGSDGEPISLDTVEHSILRPGFEDARVHAAINCASESCPPLRAEAFAAERLDAQLDGQVRAWLANPALNRFDRERRRLEVSALFDWFEGDFVRDAGSVQAWIARYAPPGEAAWLEDGGKVRIDHLSYSWKLNDVERARR